jgi:PAS domain S-box-containing protein
MKPFESRGLHSTLEMALHHHRMERKLKESEEKFRRLFEASNDAIFIVDPKTKRLVDCNKKAEKLTGYTRKKLLSMGADQLHPKDSVKETMVDFEKHAAGQMVLVESEVLTKGKKRIPVSINSSPVEIAGERYLQSIFRDITERKEAEEKIKGYSKNLEHMVERRTEELNRALSDAETARDKIDGILKSVADGLIVTDIYNRIILMNRAAEDLLGVRLSEVIDRPIDFAIQDKTLRERIKAPLDKKESGYQFDFELPLEGANHPRIMRARTSVIEDKHGEQTGIITIIHDVTYECEVDRMKTEFISTAAHELRSPLTSIQGFSEILLLRGDISEEERKKFLSYINKQAVALAGIVSDLLDISRIESRRGFALTKVKCNVGDIIKHIVLYFQDISSKHKFEVSLSDGRADLFVDKEKMEQVLKNILSNATKYSLEGGLIRVIGEVSAEHYQVSIQDEGIGMNPEQVEKIFDKFYRVDASNMAIEGTGLGMSIVKYIVEAHGGKVFVESGLGKGTRVRFTIPI